MVDLPREIRGVMIPVTDGRLLLPNATVAEVIAYTTPARVPNAPPWLLGSLVWRGWQVPLFSFPVLAGQIAEENCTNARVAVLKALGRNAAMPFIALLTQGFPRLTTITQELLVTTSEEDRDAPGVRKEVLVGDDRAVIPDLDSIETRVAAALAA